MLAFLKNSTSRHIVPLQRAMSTETRFQPRPFDAYFPVENYCLHTSAFDPFTYTQGHWLDRDKERQDVRRLHFDFDALLDVAIKCSPGARRVTHCEKKEGGFNRIFMIQLDNKSTVVARLPTRLAGPPGLTISSEVATLQFGIHSHRQILGITLTESHLQ